MSDVRFVLSNSCAVWLAVSKSAKLLKIGIGHWYLGAKWGWKTQRSLDATSLEFVPNDPKMTTAASWSKGPTSFTGLTTAPIRRRRTRRNDDRRFLWQTANWPDSIKDPRPVLATISMQIQSLVGCLTDRSQFHTWRLIVETVEGPPIFR